MKSTQIAWRLVLAVFGAVSLLVLGPATAANPDHVAQFKKTHVCPKCDLSGSQLSGIQAADAKLAGANLTDADLYGGNLRGADLAGAILTGANLEMVNLTGATGAALADARTDKRTTCPDGTAGPCR